MIRILPAYYAAACDWCGLTHDSTHADPQGALSHALGAGWELLTTSVGMGVACPGCAVEATRTAP